MSDALTLGPSRQTQSLDHRSAKWRTFLLMVGVASALPFVAVPVSQHVAAGTQASLEAMVILSFLGNNFHVALTGWFYTDREMRPHFAARPWRYAIVPAGLIAGMALLFHFATPLVRSIALAAFLCWQLWHYQKQNVGLLSFIASGSASGAPVPVSAWERRVLGFAAIPGILGFFSLTPIGLPQFAAAFMWSYAAGALLYVPVVIGAAIAIVKVPALRTSRLRLATFLFGVLFFLPTYLFHDPVSATASYALAHGLQYVVFMGVVAGGRAPLLPSLIMLIGIGTLGALLLNSAILAPDMKDFPYGFAAYGAFLGVVMSHFVLDAGIWRLREPFQRGYMRRRFAFVFAR